MPTIQGIVHSLRKRVNSTYKAQQASLKRQQASLKRQREAEAAAEAAAAAAAAAVAAAAAAVAQRDASLANLNVQIQEHTNTLATLHGQVEVARATVGRAAHGTIERQKANNKLATALENIRTINAYRDKLTAIRDTLQQTRNPPPRHPRGGKRFTRRNVKYLN